MYGYIIPWIQDPEGGQATLAADPKARRLMVAGPWQLSRWAGTGVLATWSGSSFRLPDYLPPVDTMDGMQYCGSKVPFSTASLGKADALPDVIVKLACGIEISVGLATGGGGRRRSFGAKEVIGPHVEEFHQLAVDVSTRLEADGMVPLDDLPFSRLLFLAVSRRYRVTEEALNEWGIITTSDDVNIFRALTGQSPKVVAAVGAT
jgi:hypothetical protein